MKKLIAMLGAVVAAVTSAFAATPVAVWDGDFSEHTKGGYTIDENGNTNNGDNITISGPAGVTVTGTGGQLVTVLVKAKYTPTQSDKTEVLASILNGNTELVGAGGRKDSTELWGIWSGNQWSSGGAMQKTASNKRSDDGASHKIAVTYTYTANLSSQNLQGTTIYYDGERVQNWNGLRTSTVNVGSAAIIGGPKASTNTNLKPATGMVIEGIAIFGTTATEDDIKNFKFPSEITSGYDKWALSNAVLTWKGTVVNDFHNGPFTLFDVVTGSDTETQYGSSAASGIPGQTESITPWTVFCVSATASANHYVVPGYTLRLAPDSGTAGNLNAQFSTLALGGLIVEPGATGYQFNSGESARDTMIGNNSTAVNATETWFSINEDFTFNRKGPFVLHGTLNFDVAEGKVLDINSVRTGQNLTLNAASHGNIKLHGKGNLKVHNLNASGAVTLDYTDVDLSRENPYVTGTITVGASTTIKLPAGIAIGDTVKLATTLSGTVDSKKILVGGDVDDNIAWEIQDGILVASAAASVIKIGEDGYPSLRYALAAAKSGDTLTLLTNLVGSGETIPAGVTIELAGHEITGTLDIKAGAVITDGGVAKIDGIATNFDITFNHKEDIGKSGSQNGTIDYAGVNGMHVRFDNAFELVNLDEAGEVTKNTGAHLKNHPYIEGITGFYRNTDHLSFAVVGTMPNAKNTTFIHMGESRTGNDGGYGLLIATGSKDDEVIVAWNKGTEIHEISRMSVPNAASSRHVYIITKDDDRDADTSTFTVYLDGQKWKTIVQSPRFMIVGGLQVGSDFGGIIKDAYNAATEANKSKYFRQSAAEDGGVINVIRAYDRIITSAEIAQYSVPSEYPYVSPNGSSARTVEGSVNWITETAEWSNTPAGETTATLETAPLAGAIDLTASAAATISVNLDTDATCEALTLKESAMSFVKGGEGAIIPTAATIGVPVTLVPTALDLSATKTMIVGDGKIIADYSGYDVKSIYTEKSVFVTGEIDQQAEGIVTATLPTCEYRTIGALAYNTTTHQYGFTVTPVMVNVTIPSIEHTTVSVTAGTLNCTITEGVASVPGGADITVTYAPVAGYHFTAETPVASVTASDVTAETEISVAGVTPVEINKYTVKVMQVANAIATVTIGEGTPAVVTDDTVQVPHGSAFRVDYAAAEGYKLVAIEGDEAGLVTENYHYGQVIQNMGDYTLHFEVVIAKTATALFLEAVENAATGDTVTLTGEVVLTEQLEIAGKEIIIALNGQTISYNGAALSSGIILVHNGAGLTITGDGTIDSGIAMVAVAVTKSGDDATTPAKLTINGGTLIGQNYGISGNGKRANTIVTINGGVIKAIKEGDGTGIYQPQLGSLEVTGGTIQGTTFGIYAKSGSVSISGGTIKSTATEIVDPSVNNNGTSGKGYALVLEKLAAGEGGYANNLTAEVTGGTFEAPTAILSWARTGSERLTKFVADGVTLTETTPSAADIKKSYVEPSSDLPGAEEVPAADKDAYNEWAAENGVTADTTTASSVLATAFAMNVSLGDYTSIEEAAQQAVEDEVPSIDMAELVAGNLEDAVKAINEKYSGKVEASLVEVTEGTLKSTETAKFYKLSITIKK